jgi:CBS domain-containing protein
MVRKNMGSVVITQEDRPVGIVTERDILKSIAHRRTRPDTRVEEIMSKPLVSIQPDAILAEAGEIMIKKKIRRHS